MPDFEAYVAPQRADADMTIQVLPTQLVENDDESKILRVKLIQKEGNPLLDPVYLFDEGSTVEWIPCGKKLSCSFPGIKFGYGPDTFLGNEVSVVEMDGKVCRDEHSPRRYPAFPSSSPPTPNRTNSSTTWRS